MLVVLLMGVLLNDVGGCRLMLVRFMGVLNEVVGWFFRLYRW